MDADQKPGSKAEGQTLRVGSGARHAHIAGRGGGGEGAGGGVIAIVSTHTTRHLRLTLLGLARQTRRADVVILSCDNDSPEIAALARSCSREFQLPLLLVQRPHAGIARLGQVRNNAVRALMRCDPGIADSPGAILVFFDGDILCPPDGLAIHERLMNGHGQSAHRRTGLTIAHRIDLTPEQTERVQTASEDAGADLFAAAGVSPGQLQPLSARARRYRRQLLMRRLGLAKPHKPKMLGANFGVRLEAYLAVNGCDERFEGYGQEDDDLTRRLYQHGAWPAIAVDVIRNLHLYHPTRAPGDWSASPAVAMLHAEAPTRCVQGVENPRAQSEIAIERLG